MGSTVTRIPVTTEPKRLVNGPYENLNCFNPCSLAVATECFGLLRNSSVSSMRCRGHQDRWFFLESHRMENLFRSCVALVALWCAN